jgi:hypothetical protein
LVEALIDDLEGCLAEADLDEPVEVVVGDYPSPTLLIDGIDVATGEPVAGQPRCRMDLPSRSHIQAAVAHLISSLERARFSRPGEPDPHGPRHRVRLVTVAGEHPPRLQIGARSHAEGPRVPAIPTTAGAREVPVRGQLSGEAAVAFGACLVESGDLHGLALALVRGGNRVQRTTNPMADEFINQPNHQLA